MTTEEIKPKTGAKLANKRRVLTILILLLCSSAFLFWHERPRVNLHNTSTEIIHFTIDMNGETYSSGTIAPNTQYILDLPMIKGRNAAIYFKGKTKDKIISTLARTHYIGSIDFYIRPDLNVTMEPTPPGFMVEQDESDPVIINAKKPAIPH